MEEETTIVVERKENFFKIELEKVEEIEAGRAFYEVERKLEAEEYIEKKMSQQEMDGVNVLLREGFADRDLKVFEFIQDVSVLASKMSLTLFLWKVEESTLELLEKTYGILGNLNRRVETLENKRELIKVRKQVYDLVKKITDQCIPLDLIEEIRGFGCKYRVKEERRYLEEGSKNSKILLGLDELNILRRELNKMGDKGLKEQEKRGMKRK